MLELHYTHKPTMCIPRIKVRRARRWNELDIARKGVQYIEPYLNTNTGPKISSVDIKSRGNFM